MIYCVLVTGEFRRVPVDQLCTCITYREKQDPDRVQFPSSSMNLPQRDRSLLPPKSIGADERHENCHAVTGNRERYADLVES